LIASIVIAWPYLILGFLVGSIPFGLILGRVFFKSDIRSSGSGNIGAANAARTYGRGAGIAVFILDALKGVVPVVLASHTHIAPLVALMTVVGHCYSPWLKFKGGKGVATFFGTLCALGPYGPAVFAVVWIALILRLGYASLSSMLATIAAALVICAGDRDLGDGGAAIVFAVLSVVIIVGRHGANIARLRAGTEPKLELKKSEGPSGSGGKRVGSI
jgi:glycerol-3-phosphate acyltransferase PlsY